MPHATPEQAMSATADALAQLTSLAQTLGAAGHDMDATARQWAQTVLVAEARLGPEFSRRVAHWRRDPQVREFATDFAAAVTQPLAWWPPGTVTHVPQE